MCCADKQCKFDPACDQSIYDGHDKTVHQDALSVLKHGLVCSELKLLLNARF